MFESRGYSASEIFSNIDGVPLTRFIAILSDRQGMHKPQL
jgi:hypothetical protein